MSAPVVAAYDLAKHYGTTVGLEGLDLTIEAGEIVGFLGPNGAGKTTTIRLLLDLIRPTRGRAELFGRAPGERAVRARVGYLPGDLALDPRLSGEQMLDLLDGLRPAGSAPCDARRRDALCERLDLTATDRARRLRDCSTGTRQKVGLVAAFQHDPELLVLDEPTTGLDPLVRDELFGLLLEAGARGATVFHSSHVLSEVDRTCTRVAVLREGRLVTIEDVADLREGLARKVTARFAGPAPRAALEAVPGVELLEVDGARVVLRVQGGLPPLLACLAAHDVVDLTAPGPDLEEVFHALYKAAGAAGDGQAAR